TTTGPGAANTAGAMGEARASRSPVLHISTQVESRLLEGRGGRFSLHESPHQRELMDAVSVWTATVARAEAIPTMVQRAAIEALAGRRGPSFLEIPHDLLSEKVSWEPQPAVTERTFPPEPSLVERAVDTLSRAKRPLVWAGGGAISSGAGSVLAKVAEVLDAPIVTSYAGKGIVAPGHPLCVGFASHQPEVTSLIRSADAALIVGSDLDGMNTQAWRLPLPRPRVAINTIAEDARRNYAADVVIEADAREMLEAMLPHLRARSSDAGRRVADVRKAADASLRATKEFAAPYRFVKTVSAAAGDAVVLADMAVPGYWLAGYHRPPRARTFAYPVGWGTLGFALPAAVGVGASGARALAVCGDAGISYALGELATLAQEKLPVAVLVVNDSGYGMLRFDAQDRFGKTFASDLRAPDFVALALSFGIDARKTTQRELGTALSWALSQRGPALVELRATFAPPLTTSPRWPLRAKKEARR
ncbi:MAG: thiamine pyrophosphate-binding protein, partial [Actinobacteria bacterium]|nr:thiamine pyrophosphate-binding protein [Actinomycetota bacterium]